MNEIEHELKPLEEGDDDLIEKLIEEYNFSVIPPIAETEEKKILKINDGNGKMIAGCLYTLYRWNLAYLNLLWVDKEYRRQGLGSRLIKEYEKNARKRGCYISIIYTLDFQARPLYEKHGYEIRGTNENFPQGHEVYAFSKRLDQPSHDYVSSREPLTCFEICAGTKEDLDVIDKGFEEYNEPYRAPICEEASLGEKIIDNQGKMIAGWSNEIDEDGASLVNLWVEQSHRRTGVGTMLLKNAEQQAREKGACVMLVYVFDWQKGFFEKNGFHVWMKIEDCPKGHAYYAMKKEL